MSVQGHRLVKRMRGEYRTVTRQSTNDVEGAMTEPALDIDLLARVLDVQPPVSRPQGPLLALTDAPSSDRLQPMTEPEFKRLRHRRYVKKSYDKQMNRTRRLREELVTLETQYNEMLRRQVEGTVTRMPLLQKYIEITRLKDRLYEENLALQQYNGEFMIVESRLQGIFDTEAEPPVADMKFSFSPLPNAEYARVIASSREYIAKFMQSEGKMTTGVQVLGWEDQKQVRGDRLTFALRKQFAFSAFELLKRTWAIVSSADEFPKIYNPALNTTMHVLQRINEDTVLFYRSVKADNSDVAAKTVFLLARVKVEHGYLLVFRSIDKDLIAFEENGINKVIEEIQAAGESKKTVDVWVEKFVWIIIYENGERTSEFHFGGTASSKLWFKEVLFMVLRWESMAVGSPILIQA